MNINYALWKSNALKLFALTLVFLFAIQNSQGQTGTSCADPIDLNPNMPANGNGSYSFYLDNTSGSKFYSFTATENGTAEMSSCLDVSNTDTYLKLYVDDCVTPLSEADNSGCFQKAELITDVIAGKTYVFEWSDQKGGGPIEATFYFQLPVDGSLCNSPKDLELGSNTKNYWFGPQYYMYTATEPGMIDVNTCGLQDDVLIDFYNGCDGSIVAETDEFLCPQDPYYDYGQARTIYQIAENETIVIEVNQSSSYTEFEFDFNFQFTPTGESCEVPFDLTILSEDIHQVPHACTTCRTNKWYKFTAPKSGMGIVTTGQAALASHGPIGGQEQTYIKVYSACEGSPIAENDNYYQFFGSSLVSIDFQEGETYYIEFVAEFINDSYYFDIFYEDDLLFGTEEAPLDVTLGLNDIHANMYYAGEQYEIGEQWFTYEFSSDGELTMNVTQSHDRQTLLSVVSNNDYQFTYPDEDSGPVGFIMEGVAGDVVKFGLSRTNNTFSASFEASAGEGTACSNPIDLNEDYPIVGNGSNKIPVNNSEGNQFYKYTADKVGTIKMWSGFANAPGDPDFETDLRVYKTACDNLIADIDYSPGLLGNCEFEVDVEIGDVYIFEWSNHNWGGQFDAHYFFQEPVDATSCDDPIPLILGGNRHSSMFKNQYFEYIAPQSGVLELSTCGIENAYFLYGFDLYSECLDELSVTYNYDCDLDEIYDWFTQSYSMSKGETLTVRTPSRNHDAYDFNASFTPDQGTVCENPLTLVEGINQYEHTGAARYYQFIAPADGKLEAGTCGMAGEEQGTFSIWSACTATKLAQGDGCAYDPDEYYWEYVNYDNLVANEVYTLKIIPNWTASDYSFTVDFTEVEVPGTTCSTPFDLKADYPIDGDGSQQISVNNSEGSQFYTYTADKVGTLEMWSGFANVPGIPTFETDLKVYQTTCDNLVADIDFTAGLLGNCSYVTDVNIGDTYIFEWSDHNWGGEFLADYFFQKPIQGTSCESPITLTIGENTHESYFYDQYHSYTADSAGTLRVSTCGYTSAYSVYGMEILDACDGTALGVEDWDCDPDDEYDWSTITYSIAEGETVIVKTNSRNHDGYEFSAAFTPNGQSCEDPFELSTTGKYAVDHLNNVAWFSYPAEKDGTLIISTCGLGNDNDTEVFVYDDCGNEAIATSDDFCALDSRIEISVTKDEVYTIFWSDEQIILDGSTGEYEFELVYLEDIFGKEQDDATIVEAGSYSTQNRLIEEQWFKYIMPEDGTVKISGCNSSNVIDEEVQIVTVGAGDISYACLVNGVNKIGLYQGVAGEEVYVKWSNPDKQDIPFTVSFESTPCVAFTDVEMGATFAVDNSADHDYFRFLAHSSGTAVASSCRAGFDTRIFAWEEFCGNAIATADGPSTCGNGTMITFAVEQGEYYYVQFRNDETNAQYEADIFLKEEKVGYTFENPQPLDLNCENDLNNDHGLDTFYSFEMPIDGELSFSTCASPLWANYETFSAGRTKSLVVCDPDADEKWEAIIRGGQTGDIYIFKYYQYNDAVGKANLTLTPVDPEWISPTLETVDEQISTCDSYMFGDQFLSVSGEYSKLFTSSQGCDSLVNLSLIIHPKYDLTKDVSICESFEFDGNLLTVSGDYSATFQSIQGCDSLVNLSLNVLEREDEIVSRTACHSYIFNDEEFFTSGDYSATFTNKAGCDSLVNLELIIHPEYEEIKEIATCKLYEFDGKNLNFTGNYSATFQSKNGCDSLVNLNLIVYSEYEEIKEISICESYEFDGNILSSSGNYNATFQSEHGCDSLVNLSLTILESDEESVVETVCRSYIFDENELFESGDYEATFINQAGCDSLVNLALTVQPEYDELKEVSICELYEFDGNSLTVGGDYSATFLSTQGCDSLVNLSLTILERDDEVVSISACHSYIFDENKLFESGDYDATFINQVGCDSLVILNLTIHDEPSSEIDVNGTLLTAEELNATSYQWINCDTNTPIDGETQRQLTPPGTGAYAVEVSNDNCTVTSDCLFFDWVVSVPENSLGLHISIYPTLTPQQFTIDLNQIYENVEVLIIALSGKLMMQKNFKTMNSREFKLDGPSGVYLVQVSSENQLFPTQRIIKTK